MMKVKELMTKKVVTINKESTIEEAALLLLEYDIGMLVVINENREVLGVVTDRDIVIRGLAKGKTGNAKVDEVMTHNCIDIYKEENINRALEMMGEYQVRRLVILNADKKLCGIISLADVARGKHTNRLVNEILYEISIPNPQKEKPLKYLHIDDYPL
jgi:CBS domain-containing protein